jgi:hypothetical protein
MSSSSSSEAAASVGTDDGDSTAGSAAAGELRKRKKKPTSYRLDTKLKKFWKNQLDEVHALTGEAYVRAGS